jgi:hypothetical protein
VRRRTRVLVINPNISPTSPTALAGFGDNPDNKNADVSPPPTPFATFATFATFGFRQISFVMISCGGFLMRVTNCLMLVRFCNAITNAFLIHTSKARGA